MGAFELVGLAFEFLNEGFDQRFVGFLDGVGQFLAGVAIAGVHELECAQGRHQGGGDEFAHHCEGFDLTFLDVEALGLYRPEQLLDIPLTLPLII